MKKMLNYVYETFFDICNLHFGYTFHFRNMSKNGKFSNEVGDRDLQTIQIM